jgi:hypothetical protein
LQRLRRDSGPHIVGAEGREGKEMGFCLRMTAIAAAAATLGCFSGYAEAGDDGAAPLWVGIGSIFSPLMGFSKDEKPPIDYREHGKLVLPPNTDLPAPGAAKVQTGGDWPVNQEVQRKNLAKEEAKKQIAGQGDARLRYTHPFPNAPVTVQPSDRQEASGGVNARAPSVLGSLNPLSWVGMGKSVPLGPEPDREWLTDPPNGYRAPVGATGQAGQ